MTVDTKMKRLKLLLSGRGLIAAAILLTAAGLSVPARAQTPDPAPVPQPQTPQDPPAPPTYPDQDQELERPRRERFRIGPEVGFFLPTDKKTRDVFGDSWVSFGLGLGKITSAEDQRPLGLDVYILYKKSGDNRAFLIPIGLQYRRPLNKGRTAAYAGVSADLIPGEIRVPAENRRGFKVTAGASAFIGTTVGTDAYVEARYLVAGSLNSYNVSGLNLSAGFRF